MSSPTQPTVLVVDDEADLRQLIAESLSADGFEVVQAPDAGDAVERLKNSPTTPWSSTSAFPTRTAWKSSTRRCRDTPRSSP